MVSWWGSTSLDELTENATSELLPAGQEDQALQFEISDMIKTKKVKPKDAVQSIRKRLTHKNPNVVLATLSLADVCVKNGGDAFVEAVDSHDFMMNMVDLLDNDNSKVSEKVLTLIQSWAVALRHRVEFSIIANTYLSMKQKGVRFPALNEAANPYFLETAVAPEWTDSNACERCRVAFTFTNRKHHCRQCGRTFCQQCSSKSLPLPHLAIHEEVRVCDGCYTKVKLAKIAKKDSLPPIYGTAAPPMPSFLRSAISGAKKTQPVPSIARDDESPDNEFDEDMKKAIELSLKEEEPRKAGYSSGYDLKTNVLKQSKSNENKSSEDDSDLAAAIAASLQDMKISSTPLQPLDSTQQPEPSLVRTDELSGTEMGNIAEFSVLVEHLHSLPEDPSVVEAADKLYANVGVLQPKLIKSLNEASRKHQQFAQLHKKLSEAVKKYDGILEKRLENTYNLPVEKDPHHSYYSSMPTSNPYPTVTPSPAVVYTDQSQQQGNYPVQANPAASSPYPRSNTMPSNIQESYYPQLAIAEQYTSEEGSYITSEEAYFPPGERGYPSTIQKQVGIIPRQDPGEIKYCPQHSQQPSNYYYDQSLGQESLPQVQSSPQVQPHPQSQSQQLPSQQSSQPQPYQAQQQPQFYEWQQQQPYDLQQSQAHQGQQQAYQTLQPHSYQEQSQQSQQYQTYNPHVSEAPLIDL